jgi:hypothetical protein
MFQYFFKLYDNKPVGIIRISINNVQKRIIDQYWNRTMKDWKDGSFGMYELSVGDANTIATTAEEAQKMFPEAPWNK